MTQRMSDIQTKADPLYTYGERAVFTSGLFVNIKFTQDLYNHLSDRPMSIPRAAAGITSTVSFENE